METFYIYTDGSTLNQGTEKRDTWESGWAVIYPLKDDEKEYYSYVGKLPKDKSTNNIAELVAIGYVFDLLDQNYEANRYQNITILSDSEYSCNVFNKFIKTWMKKCAGNININNKEYPNWTKANGRTIENLPIIYYIQSQRMRYPNVKIQHIMGHSKNNDTHSKFNNIADQEAKKAAGYPQPFNIPEWLY